ncbi:MAG: TetR/AcrR family transcriptional regulator [Cytophagales bacterium]|nr:TetR/AcrR family transcriptional regulator [Cytophagales bacterium]
MARNKEFEEAEVLEKAVNLFWCKGYNGTSMQDVVDCLGISRSSLYDTFGDKRQLYLAALNQYRSQMAGALLQTVQQATSVVPTLSRLFEMAVHESLADRLGKGCFMVNSTVELAPHDPEVARIVKANMEDIEEAFYQLIRKGQEQGEVTPKHDARALARFLFNTMSGLRVAAKAGAGRGVYDDVVNLSLSVLR